MRNRGNVLRSVVVVRDGSLGADNGAGQVVVYPRSWRFDSEKADFQERSSAPALDEIGDFGSVCESSSEELWLVVCHEGPESPVVGWGLGVFSIAVIVL